MFFMSKWLEDEKRPSLDAFPFDLLGHAGEGGSGALKACAHVAVPLTVVQVRNLLKTNGGGKRISVWFFVSFQRSFVWLDWIGLVQCSVL